MKDKRSAMANLINSDLNLLTGMGNNAKSKSLAVDLEMETFDPSEILPEKANIAPVNHQKQVKQAIVSDSLYMLPSGKRTKCKLILIDEPAKETIVWHGNPRFNEDPPVDDIIESIESNGTNAEPVKVKLNNGIYEIITGSRRRKATISAKKPLTALLLEDVNDDDAKMLAVIENEGRLDPNPFTIASSYLALLSGENAVFDSVTTLAKRLGKSRTWASQVLSINDLPKIIEDSLNEDEKYKLSIRRVVELATLWRRLIKEELTDKALAALSELHKIDLKNCASLFNKLLEVQNKPKTFNVKTSKAISENASVVKTPDGLAILIKIKSEDKNELVNSLNEAISSIQ